MEPQTDFIFAIIGEELGFVGCCVVIILLLLIVIECIVIGLRQKTPEGASSAGVLALVGDSDIYQYQCGDRNFSEYRNIPSVCKLWTDILVCFLRIGLVLNVGLQPKISIEETKVYEHRISGT